MHVQFLEVNFIGTCPYIGRDSYIILLIRQSAKILNFLPSFIGLYADSNSTPTPSPSLQPPLPDQNQKPVAPFPEKDGAKELAAHLTVYDWNLFSNIQQMEYIYHLFGRHKFNRITTNLDLIIKRFNEVTEIIERSAEY